MHFMEIILESAGKLFRHLTDKHEKRHEHCDTSHTSHKCTLSIQVVVNMFESFTSDPNKQTT